MEISRTKKLTHIALAAAIMCVLCPVSVSLPISPVPVSFGLFAIYLGAYILGAKHGVYSVVIYILLGLVGLPVFAGFTGGAAKLLGPTGGYILGYIFAALSCGFFVERFESKKAMHLVGMIIGTALCYMFGTIWLAVQAEMSFGAALLAGVIPFIPADCVKIAAIMLVCPKLRSAVRMTERIRN